MRDPHRAAVHNNAYKDLLGIVQTTYARLSVFEPDLTISDIRKQLHAVLVRARRAYAPNAEAAQTEAMPLVQTGIPGTQTREGD